MNELFGVPLPALLGQLTLGLVNGSFYAILSLGLAVIFGMLHIINFAHGACYMLGAMLTWMALEYLGLGYWWALLLVPPFMALIGRRFIGPEEDRLRAAFGAAADDYMKRTRRWL